MFTTTTKQQQQCVNEDRWTFVIMFVDSDTVNTKNKTSVFCCLFMSYRKDILRFFDFTIAYMPFETYLKIVQRFVMSVQQC